MKPHFFQSFEVHSRRSLVPLFQKDFPAIPLLSTHHDESS
jgi:hypothetical protein